jgi:hypothetical protein
MSGIAGLAKCGRSGPWEWIVTEDQAAEGGEAETIRYTPFFIIGLIREPGWFSHSPCSFSPIGCETCIFKRLLFGKLKFPNNSIIYLN